MLDKLPPPLEALAAYQQFIIYRLVPSLRRPGKLDKKPINPRNGNIENPLEPNVWVGFDTALQTVKNKGSDYGVGFVFTENDPFWFLDIDDCLQPDNTWSPIATELCAFFSGAAIEVSSSGKGLHIFGTGGVPRHSCKNKALNLELYTGKRFVALTGTNIIGDISHDFSDKLPELVSKYFLPGEVATANQYSTNQDSIRDEQLLEKMLASKSAHALFGGGISFEDLWTANAEALSKAYPSAGRAYDASSSDAALAQHLAFWTKKNPEHIKRFMLQSALRRNKWDRPDYLDRTINKACMQQNDVYQSVTDIPLPTPITENNAMSWRDVSIIDLLTNPPLSPRFLIQSLLPAGVLTLLGAHGGAGKSMLALQAAICLAIGQPFMGKETQQSRILFFSGEDTDSIIRHRLTRICQSMQINPTTLTNLKIIDATANPCLYASVYGKTTTTVGYKALEVIANDFNADVIIIDNASDTFDANENERARVREFVRKLVQVGKKQAAAILLR